MLNPDVTNLGCLIVSDKYKFHLDEYIIQP